MPPCHLFPYHACPSPCMPPPCMPPCTPCHAPAMHVPCHACPHYTCPLHACSPVNRLTDRCKNITFPQLCLQAETVELLVNKPLLNVAGVKLDTRNVEQMKDVHMYIEEFILVDIWIHYCTCRNSVWN